MRNEVKSIVENLKIVSKKIERYLLNNPSEEREEELEMELDQILQAIDILEEID